MTTPDPMHASSTDRAQWNAFPIEMKQVIQRLMYDGIVMVCPRCEKEYNDGYERGYEEGQGIDTNDDDD